MARRKRFGSTPVGLARGDLERAQQENEEKSTRASRRAVAGAEKRLLREIDRQKGRKQGKK